LYSLPYKLITTVLMIFLFQVVTIGKFIIYYYNPSQGRRPVLY